MLRAKPWPEIPSRFVYVQSLSLLNGFRYVLIYVSNIEADHTSLHTFIQIVILVLKCVSYRRSWHVHTTLHQSSSVSQLTLYKTEKVSLHIIYPLKPRPTSPHDQPS